MLIYSDENLEVTHRDRSSPYLLVTFNEMEYRQTAATSAANAGKTCPVDDSRRERLIKATRERFAKLMRAGHAAVTP